VQHVYSFWQWQQDKVQQIPHELAKEAHDWLSTDKRNKVNFAYYARKALKNHSDCIEG
jgi:L-fuculose-phosphate aldolase